MTKEEIKDNYSMRDIAARYGFKPNRAGFIPCPFHSGDNQASMKLYDRDYHCFSCNENGDIFSFIQRMEDVGFKEAFALMGGTYEPVDPKTAKLAAIRFMKKKSEGLAREGEFKQWYMKRLGEICRQLQLLERLIPSLEPLTEEWGIAITMKQSAEYRYEILACGTREEQEEMRGLDG